MFSKKELLNRYLFCV